jgi:hypothetical protein
VHSGACGVCSNAGDLAARMATISTLQSQSITCGFDYVLDSSFDGLVSCYTDIGFSTPCATLYAHYTATNFNLCGKQGVCFPDQATNELTMNNFSQPGCPFNACYNCSVSFGAVFDKLSGLGCVYHHLVAMSALPELETRAESYHRFSPFPPQKERVQRRL